MSEERKTLFELAPDTFTVPGASQNGTAPLPDLVFVRDEHIPGLYRAPIDRSSFFVDGDDKEMSVKSSNGA